ncbi:Rho guanine nucleotide exchange factor [Marasmius sp. AFHP31]|nr:Rho guanine nucleotide exchange factor [Marasmius sp. AFHP31]
MTDPGLEDAQRVLQSVLNDAHKYRKIIDGKGDDAQKCLDLLQVLAEQPEITNELQASIVKMMLHLLKRSGQLNPICLTAKNVKRRSAFPVGSGGFGYVYKGVIGEQMVCLKLPRIFHTTEDPEVDKLLKAFMREATVWRQLKHPNLLPFIGAYYLQVDEASSHLCLISPWMDCGDLNGYLKNAREQNTDVDRLLLAYDVAAGLSYLHKKKIVHGDLKGANVLINADGRALIGDFGLSRVVETHTPGLFNSTTGGKGTVRWLSPELLKSSDPPCQTSRRSDIYAYAGVCYEIFTGNYPFYKLRDEAVYDAVVNCGECPHRPEEAGELSDPMWEIMRSCWQHNQHLRPSVEAVVTQIGELQNPKTGVAVRLSALDSSSWSHTQVRPDVKYPPIDTAVLDRLLSTPSINDPDGAESRLNSQGATSSSGQTSPLSPSPLSSNGSDSAIEPMKNGEFFLSHCRTSHLVFKLLTQQNLKKI